MVRHMRRPQTDRQTAQTDTDTDTEKRKWKRQTGEMG